MSARTSGYELLGSSWSRRYAVAIFAAVAAVFFVGLGLLAGEQSVAISGAVVMGTYALLAFMGGRTGTLRMLRGDYDEREQRFDHRALSVSSTAVGLALLILWARDVLDGRLGTVPQWLLALMGATYGVTILYYRWRDR
jgi:hypothetical protein